MITLQELGIHYRPSIAAQEDTRFLVAIHDGKRHPDENGWNEYWKMQLAGSNPTYLNRPAHTATSSDMAVYRYNGEYIIAPVDTEARYSAALRDKLFRKYFAGLDVLAEFGCGSGNNLKQLAELFPGAILYGYDWSESAVELTSQLGVIASRFDMINPRPLPELELRRSRLGVLTHGAMEQLGDDFRRFLDFMLDLRAAVYVHVEPIIEFYDPNSHFDQIGLEYHKKRGYLGTFLTALRGSGVNIILEHQSTFGNRYNDGYSCVVWAPQPKQ